MAHPAHCASAPTIFNFRSTEVRTLVLDGEAWFVASDVAKALAYTHAPHMLRVLDEDEKGVRIVDTLGGPQELGVISESGLYHAVLKSRKPEAKPFRKWVTSEVLPAIRKTGQYVAQPYSVGPNDTLTAEQADTLRNLLTTACNKLPKAQQGAFMMRGWSKLKAHFKRGYREIPQVEFAEAVSLVARHIAEQGELIEEAPQPPADMVSKAHALRCFDLAGALASATQQATVRQLLDLDERDLRLGRFIVACNGDTPFVNRLEEDAVVLSWGEAPKLIATNDSAIDTATLQAIANAAIKRLTQRVPPTSSVFR